LKWFVPSGVKAWFQSSGIPPEQVKELVWWEESELDETRAKIVFTPSNHWSRRSLTDENFCLWGSWAVIGAQVEQLYLMR